MPVYTVSLIALPAVFYRALLLLSISLGCVPLTAETLKISTLYPPGSAPVLSLNALSAELESATQGGLTLKVYPGGVMGDDATVLRKMRIGQLQGALVSSSTLEALDVDINDLSQPFQFDTLAEVYQARTSFDGTVRERLARRGWHGFGPLDGGFSYVMSQQPVTDLAGLRASKLWLPNTDTIRELSQQIRVDYQVLGIADVLPALETGALDALIAPPSAALTLNWHSRVSYVTGQPVVYTWGMLVLPERSLARLSVDQQAAAHRVLSHWAEQLDEQMRDSNHSADQALRQHLTEVSIAPPSLRSIREELGQRIASGNGS
ncbi:TRAP transporter substrate-binding protein DctP [Saccharospirillum impatiens]|uniref:TRAP transporter substrate-binding protein DctP n=1 Tax=Saccharospirillum impatiens TaxID=169438 RepID=UPI0004287A33|nr:TRAP transporter substrate-binding protein DctP [Saccharospirillum impatiens]